MSFLQHYLFFSLVEMLRTSAANMWIVERNEGENGWQLVNLQTESSCLEIWKGGVANILEDEKVKNDLNVYSVHSFLLPSFPPSLFPFLPSFLGIIKYLEGKT